MKKLLLLFVFSFTYILTSFATHNRGGIITYRHISGNMYEGIVTTYTRMNSPAGTSEIELFWGDGTSDTLQCVNGGGIGVLIAPNIRMSIYTGTHTYSSTGHYILHIEDPNRNAGVINIPNSVNIPFYLETELITSNQNTENNSVLFSGIPIFDLILDSSAFNLGFYDPDGDILTYELTTAKGDSGTEIPGYSIPAGVTVNQITGQLEWNVPTTLGEYVFAIKVTECRNGETVGTAVFDMMYTVATSSNPVMQFQNLSAWNMDNNLNYSYILQVNQSFTLPVTVANAGELAAFGEPFISPNAATFTSISSATDKLFAWQPTVARCSPYSVVFRGSGNSEKDITVLLYVREPGMEYCDTICGAALGIETIDEDKYLTVYPNPAGNTITVETLTAKGIYQLHDVTGKLLLNGNVADTKFNLDISTFSRGVYFLSLFDGERVAHRKIIKE